MLRAVLDANVFDRLQADASTCCLLGELSRLGVVEVLVPFTVASELADSPFHGIPDWFPVTCVHDSVAVLPFHLGSTALGPGAVYRVHLGKSSKRNDAKIVDSAAQHAALLVSNDKRCCVRATTAGVWAMNVDDFTRLLVTLVAGPSS